MNKASPENILESKANLFKALGHPIRLLMINLIQVKPRHGEELAAILHVTPATVSHHLEKLTSAGLLTSQKDQYYQTFSLDKTVLQPTLGDLIHLSQSGVSSQVEEDAYRNKVIRTFFRQGRLTKIPAQLKKQQVVLEKIVEEFEPDREYTEREVNIILLDFNDDIAVLRRGLISHKLMKRSQGIYERLTGE